MQGRQLKVRVADRGITPVDDAGQHLAVDEDMVGMQVGVENSGRCVERDEVAVDLLQWRQRQRSPAAMSCGAAHPPIGTGSLATTVAAAAGSRWRAATT
jgi:hypothetical protein